jgi:hypothetical protein
MKTQFLPSLKVVEDRLEIQGNEYEQTSQFKDKRDPKSTERGISIIPYNPIVAYPLRGRVNR